MLQEPLPRPRCGLRRSRLPYASFSCWFVLRVYRPPRNPARSLIFLLHNSGRCMPFILALILILLPLSELSAQEASYRFDLEPGVRIRIPALATGDITVDAQVVSVGPRAFVYSLAD